MSTPLTVRAASTERAIALATAAAPVATGVLAPLLDGGAAFTATLAYGAGAGFMAANYLGRLPDSVLAHMPGGDIVTAHRTPLFISALTTGMSLGVGTLMGPQGADALLAGVLTLPSIPGIVSLGWWVAVGLVPFKLRTVLGRKRAYRPTAHDPVPALTALPTDAEDILRTWAQHISHPTHGTHRGQELTVHTFSPTRWTGTVTAPLGASVTVTKANVSSVYQRPASWISLTPGAHEGEKHLTVSLVAPTELDASTLEGAWRKYVSPSVMRGSHLEEVQHDPATGGEVAVVVADEDQARLVTPSQDDLAGALRTTTLLCSYTPVPGNPRRGSIRLMKHNPLEEGTPFPGTHVLKASDGGYVQIGRHVSGWPARIQFVDPKLGAKHVFIAGVTGSGKGGLVQIIALADHVNGYAIIYIDPKGSSNPDVEDMAAYSALGEEGSIQGLRVAYALLQWRIAESARLKMKNFVATPDRPYVRVILDEAHVPLSELEEHKKEAGIILEALAAKARSLGIILCVVNQAVNADKLGGSTTLRTNVIQGGSLVMLRTDSDQQHLATTGFDGVDPGTIPASWDVDRPLVYDEKIQLEDPRSTYGLGFTLGPGGAAEMMRTFVLESAAPYIDPDAVQYPADWPDWDNRHEIATRSILGDGDDTASVLGLPSQPAGPAKAPTAEQKILAVLEESADPLGLEVIYKHKTDIYNLAGLKSEATLNNTLSALVRAGEIHRRNTGNARDDRGYYGLGPAPADTDPADDNTAPTPAGTDAETDDLLLEAARMVVDTQYASQQMLHRKLRIGWDTAGELLGELQARGIVGGEDDSQECDVLVAAEEAESLPHRLGAGG
ncbi:DNA translocase FtsK [Streptomyces sp. NPDC058657]|uniref:DNA translocase FtsK n=1 Tax=unclassified Streptomyces TaxID=2593676 RepID=UPI003649B054